MGFWSKLLSVFTGKKSGSAQTPAGQPRAGAGTAPGPRGSGGDTFGRVPHHPILCDQPAGEREYIISLRCPNGHRLGGPRRGSMAGKCTDPAHHASMFGLAAEDPAAECIVDCYDLVCAGGEYSCTLYFDMYHPDPPRQPAPAGLTRVG